MTTEAASQSIALVRVADILPSPENPRRLFEAHALEELSASIRTKGIIQPILLRPRGPFRAKGIRRGPGRQGWEVVAADDAVIYNRDDLTQADAQRALDVCLRRHFEIVDGERRWRASCALGAETVPAIVRPFSDSEAAEVRWIAALQHEDLDPMDESRGFHRMLALRDEKGKPVYTVDLLAARISKSPYYIYDSLVLVNIPDELARALRDSERTGITAGACRYVGRVPTAALREEVAQRVLHPEFQKEPLNMEQTQRLIRDHYCRELRTAPFDRASADLVPEAGPCGACPHNTANQADASGRIHLCTHTECFQKKMEAAWQRVAAKAAKDGMRVLSLDESLAIYPPGEAAGVMAAHSPWVELAWQPEDDLIKPEVLAINSVPTWRDLIGEVVVPLVLARDQQGLAVELADRRLCMEAAVVCDEQTGRNDSAIFRESPAKVKRVPSPAPCSGRGACDERRVTSAKPKAPKADPGDEDEGEKDLLSPEDRADANEAMRKIDAAFADLERARAAAIAAGKPAENFYAETVMWHRFTTVDDLPHQALLLATPLELINAERREDCELVDSDGSPVTQTIQWWALALKGPPQVEDGAYEGAASDEAAEEDAA